MAGAITAGAGSTLSCTCIILHTRLDGSVCAECPFATRSTPPRSKWLLELREQRQYERRNEVIAARQALEQQFTAGDEDEGSNGGGSSGGGAGGSGGGSKFG